MPKYEVFISKAYYVNGTITVEADDPDHAWVVADEQIGDFEGSMEYNPGDNMIEVGDEIK